MEEESFYMQSATDSVIFQDGASMLSQNIQFEMEADPLSDQSCVQSQQLLYQLQSGADTQQNLIYLIVPTNENMQIQSVPVTVTNDQSITSAAQYIVSPQTNLKNNTTNNMVTISDVKTEATQIMPEVHPNQSNDSLSNKSLKPKVKRGSVKNQGNNKCKSPPNSAKDTPTKPHWYHCDYSGCSKSFYSLYEKKQHLDVHMFPESTEFKCSICNMSFERAIERNKHVETHSVPPTFQCKKCRESFSYFTGLVKHHDEKVCADNTPIICFFCHTKLNDYEELIGHNHLNMRQCMCGLRMCGNQTYERHASACAFSRREGTPYPYEKKRLKTKTA